MTKEKKVWLWTIILWAVNLKIFLLLSNWEQTSQIFKYSNNLINFYQSMIEYYFDFIITIPRFTLFLAAIFIIEIFFFWLFYFKVYFYKLPKVQTEKNGYLSILATFFSFLGFGCVACGQTLLSSLLFLFVSNGTMYFAGTVGNFVILLGMLFLAYGIYRNYKLYKNPSVCQI